MHINKKIHLFLLLSCLATTVVAEQISTIKPFTTDGCSLFPDGTFKNKQFWLSCCTEHDISYWQGGTWHQRQQSDRALKRCVAKLGQPTIANLMLNGVRIGGSPFWPTSYRWGYGWDYLRGYKPLNTLEKQMINKALQQYKKDLQPKATIKQE